MAPFLWLGSWGGAPGVAGRRWGAGAPGGRPAGERAANGPQHARKRYRRPRPGRILAGSAALDLIRPDLILGNLIQPNLTRPDLIRLRLIRFDPNEFDPI